MSAPVISAQESGAYQIAGDLTFSTVSRFLAETQPLFRQADGPLVFDLAGVSRADSAGLALLIEWLRHAHAADTSLRFQHIPEQLLNMASASALGAILELPDSAQD